MYEDKIRINTAEMNTLLEQMWIYLEKIDTAFFRITECVADAGADAFGELDFPEVSESFHRQQDSMIAGMENAAEICKIYAKCEAAVSEAVEKLQLPL